MSGVRAYLCNLNYPKVFWVIPTTYRVITIQLQGTGVTGIGFTHQPEGKDILEAIAEPCRCLLICFY